MKVYILIFLFAQNKNKFLSISFIQPILCQIFISIWSENIKKPLRLSNF